MELQEKIYCRLRDDVALMKPNERISPIREMMRKFKTSQYTIQLVMDRLVAAGLLFHKPGKGYFVRDRSERQTIRLLFLYPHFPSRLYGLFQEQLNRLSEQTGLFSIHYRALEQGESYLAGVLPADYDGLIIVKSGSTVKKSLWNELQNFPLPAVFLDCELGDAEISTVSSDFYLGGLKAAAYLIDKGHRRLAILNTEPGGASIDMRCRGFIDFARNSHASVEVFDCHVDAWNSNGDKLYTVMHDYLSRNKPAFTGLFLTSAQPALQLYKVMSEFNLRIPDDISVILHDHLPENAYLQPPATSIQADIGEMVQQLVDGMLRVCRNECKFFTARLEPYIMERESVKELHEL
ncbi:substrate-binding domain-containing protein [uncultured Victivallis sp.]|uniref:substrate-binding domain-containing protein n=1 Tax=uncultured Victivallis sp. TaxID=354118 RepID=UPI0025EEFC6E|nr:substrate-binding domain-containing protein [uncultured Victivallis sp.]